MAGEQEADQRLARLHRREPGNGRPAHPDWFRSLRDQCAAAGVPFFFKQFGEWKPFTFAEAIPTSAPAIPQRYRFPDQVIVERLGTAHTGNHLDGIQHLNFPQP